MSELVDKMVIGEINGLNVTIPHKQSVKQVIDTISDEADAIGAVNTLFPRAGRIIGENTDAPGFSEDLNRVAGRSLGGIDGRGRKTLVLGAGGAARAVVYELITRGWQTLIAARRLDQSTELRHQILLKVPQAVIKSIELSSAGLAENSNGVSLVVNATSVGMYPYVDANPWPAGLQLPTGSFVFDLVYNPPMTALLKQADREGCAHAGGLGMLIDQAALSFELWTGFRITHRNLHNSVAGMR